MLGKLRGIGRVARRYAGLIGLGLVATVLLGAASVVPASAHGTVDSGRIANQTIRSVDIHVGAAGPSEIREDAVDETEIENQSIQSWNIGAEEVGTSEIRNGSVRDEDLAEGVGDGPQGPPGEDGEDGEDGVSGYEVDGFFTRGNDPEEDRNAGRGGDVSLGPAIPAGAVVQLTSQCADGKHAIGGGSSNGSTQPGSDLTVRESHPSEFQPIAGDPQGSVRATAWSVTLQNETDTAQHAQVFVVCVNIAEAQ